MTKKATVITYGCQMNVNESAKIKKILENLGYELTDNIEETDIAFLNTCTVREGAATQIYGKLGEIKRVREERLENLGYELTDNIEETDIAFLNTCTVREGAATQIYGKLGEIKRVREERGTKIVVTGCFAQEQGRELIKKFNYIDIVMGNQNIGRIPEAIEEIENRSTKHVVMTDYEDELPPRIDADFESKKTASIAITYGCNNFCTYCIVPYVRGRERSVPMAELIEEARELVRKGYKEIILLGQNVNSYGKGLSENPYVRGRERSVPMAELIEEARELVRKGYKEIILLGQNVNSYGKGLSENETFANLLQNICDIEGDFIIRFVSPHPRDFTDDVIDVIARNPKIARSLHLPLQSGSTRVLKLMNRGYSKEQYIALAEKIKVIDVIARNPKIARSLHLPLQSGSTRVLKLMNRGYSKEQYIALAEKIKERIPGVSLTADIIVGFPQETEEDFMDTLDVVEKVGFETSFMFMYSIRKGTKAAVMEGQIDDEVKKDRLHRLMSLQNSISKKLSMEYEGKTERVLVEGPSKKNKDMLSSRTSTNKIVLFKGDPSLEGQFVNVKIKECKTWTLYGELAEK